MIQPPENGTEPSSQPPAIDRPASGPLPAFRRAPAVDASGTAPDPSPGSAIRPFLSEGDIRAGRRPEPIQDIVDRLMTGIGRGAAAPAAALGAQWEVVVGPEFASKSAPGACESGRLVMLVSDGATASKMRFDTAQILRSAAKIVGDGVVTSISFRVSPRVGKKPTT